ncbi:MCE family protein [Hoyosella sp. G463]|uniref:MCE family protein n=1 Tax=Lolliginicoccus lacisalsi TaxID=2742202 RepID=A0A927JF33_9ACTN|nr:MCE family protein [Lolliginicoccus lacisalsi]MBD8507915.1 MCE family protein [Lolliginicoccus lacisalsi]
MKSIRGLIMGVLILAISALLIARGAGALDRSPKIYVEVPAVVVGADGTNNEPGLLLGSNNAVRFEGVIVGRMSKLETGLTNDEGETYSLVEMQIDEDVLRNMPDDTLVRVVPRTIFGDNELHLVAPYEQAGNGRSASTVEPGETIALDTGDEAQQLYNVYEKVMRAVYELNIDKSIQGLRELRDGVEGRGEDIGNLIVQGGDLLESFQPMIDGNVIPDLRRVAENVDSALPDIVDTLDQSAVLADVLTSREAGLRDVFVSGAAFAGDVESLVAVIKDDTIVVIDGLVRTGGAVNQGVGIDGLLNSLGELGGGLGPAFQAGKLTITLVATFEEPMPYTPADCPQYPGLSSPTCGPATPRTTNQSAMSDLVPFFPVSGNVQQLPDLDPLAAIEQELARTIPGFTPASAATGAPSAPTALMLGPLVRGAVVEVQ